MEIFDTFFSTSNDDGSSAELEYRLSCDKSQFDTIVTFMKEKTDTWVQKGPTMDLNILMGKNTRITLHGSSLIEKYCASNYIASSDWNHVVIGSKTPVTTQKQKNGSKITLSNEMEASFADLAASPESLRSYTDEIQSIVKESVASSIHRIDLSIFRKLFRLRNRQSFVWNNMVRVDLTRVKENQTTYDLGNRKKPKTTLTMIDAQLGKQPLKYEVEIEVLKKDSDAIQMMKDMIQEIEGVIELNTSKIPLLTSQMNAYKSALRYLISSHFEYLKSSDRVTDDDTMPSSVIDAQNRYLKGNRPQYIIPKLVSITKEYVPIPEGMAVTDKADGDSCIVMTFNGAIIVFDNSFELLTPIRTGISTDDSKVSLYAGEYIRTDKSGLSHDTVYLYDCYMNKGEDVRRLNLVSEKPDEKTRIRVVNEFVESVKEGEPVIGEGVRMRAKRMVLGDAKSVSEDIWRERHSYPYVLDGIIFTPAYKPVGMSETNTWEWGYRMDRTWIQNLKWKPPEYNSVDFILRWSSGVTRGVGGGLIRKGELRTTEIVEKHGIKATTFPLFQPTEYSKPKPYIVEVELNATREATTEETNEYIRNRSIVECRYDMEKEGWVIMRNRKDKTSAWDHSWDALTSTREKYRLLIELANQKGAYDWQRNVTQKIPVVGGAGVQERKKKRFLSIQTDLLRFLVFHDIVPSLLLTTFDQKRLVKALREQKDAILSLLDDPFVPIPLPFSLSGSNSTFVANTIWKSIHEPVRITDFTTSGPASGAGSDVAPAVSYSGRLLQSIPLMDKTNHELMNVMKTWIEDSESVSSLEISDRETRISDRETAMLWTNKVSLRKQPWLIRGDARKFRSGWLNKDDKTTWNRWKKESGGAKKIMCVSLWGNLTSAKERKGLIESITKSSHEEASEMAMLYWDHSKIAAAHPKTEIWKTVGDYSHKKRRGGHLVFKDERSGSEYEVTAWPEDKLVNELNQAGWKVKTDVDITVEGILKEDPIGNFLSLMILNRNAS